MAGTRYRFSTFVLSPARRVLLHAGREVPLIPRYFDLLVLLVERRGEAVTRREIFDRVWSDVVVSDGALSQAVRSLRRALGDDPRQPVFIRTVSRHGYRFVHPDVLSEADEPPWDLPGAAVAPPDVTALPADGGSSAPDVLVDQLLDASLPTEDRRDAAEALHATGTPSALKALADRPADPEALALLRDSRWDVPGAQQVPLLGRPGGAAALARLAWWRLRQASREAAGRWASCSGGGAVAGLAAGIIGGLVLVLCSQSSREAAPSLPAALGLVGLLIGAVGAAGVGAGLSLAEALSRSWRKGSLVLFGALGGGIVGSVAHLLGRWTLEDLFGGDLASVGGGIEGLVIGAFTGLGYGLGAPGPAGGGMAAPRGAARARAAVVTGLLCAAGCIALTLAGRRLGGDSLDLMARSFPGSRAGLAPLARLMGEPQMGSLTRVVVSAYEGLLFGAGVALGLTRRPRS